MVASAGAPTVVKRAAPDSAEALGLGFVGLEDEHFDSGLDAESLSVRLRLYVVIDPRTVQVHIMNLLKLILSNFFPNRQPRSLTDLKKTTGSSNV